jgi:hypothetical protein
VVSFEQARDWPPSIARRCWRARRNPAVTTNSCKPACPGQFYYAAKSIPTARLRTLFELGTR